MKDNRVKCASLMVGDWIADVHGFPMQVVTASTDYMYADFEGNEGDLWEYDDKLNPCYGIPVRGHEDAIKAVTDMSVGYKYIHEIQHFLRLVGKEKEANNIVL